MENVIFNKGENVKWDFETHGGTYQCICADNDTAVFAPIAISEELRSVSYKNMFAVSNLPMLNDVINYEKLG